jgi:hypothetical protein
MTRRTKEKGGFRLDEVWTPGSSSGAWKHGVSLSLVLYVTSFVNGICPRTLSVYFIVWTTDGLWTRLLLLLWTQNSCSALLLNVVFHCWLENGISRLEKLSYCLQFPCVIRTFCIVQWTSLAYLIYQDVWYIRSCYIRTRMNGTAETLLRPSI